MKLVCFPVIILFFSLANSEQNFWEEKDPLISLHEGFLRAGVFVNDTVYQNDKAGRLEIHGNCVDADSLYIHVYPPLEECAEDDPDFIKDSVFHSDTVPLYFICYDPIKLKTHYTESYIVGKLLPYQKNSKRPEFKTAKELLGYDFGEKGWKLPKIEAKMERDLTKEQRNKFFFPPTKDTDPKIKKKMNKNFYLSKGHLVPKNDFYSHNGQVATFFFINTSPQWQAVNGGDGNWEKLENNIRDYANRTGLPVVEVWTGSFEVLTLPNDVGTEIPLYLDTDATTGAGRLPVPKYFFKIMYNFRTKEGVAYVQLNNPHTTKSHEEEKPCEDHCDKLPEVWLNPTKLAEEKRKNPVNGYLYCCDIQELHKSKIQFVPKLPKAKLPISE